MRRPLGLHVKWQLPEQGRLHADPACHEVEASEEAGASAAASAGHTARQTAPGRAAECFLPSLHPGTHYQACTTALTRLLASLQYSTMP